MSEFKIFKAEVTPSKGGAQGSVRIYPFDEMEIGDAFDAPDDMGTYGRHKGSKRQNAVSNCARTFCKSRNPSAKFVTRKHDGFIRCHRIA